MKSERVLRIWFDKPRTSNERRPSSYMAWYLSGTPCSWLWWNTVLLVLIVSVRLCRRKKALCRGNLALAVQFHCRATPFLLCARKKFEQNIRINKRRSKMSGSCLNLCVCRMLFPADQSKRHHHSLFSKLFSCAAFSMLSSKHSLVSVSCK